MSDTQQTYPRPDFQRTNLRWKSLNGPWDFLFDDEDVGFLEQRWHRNGLPDEVTVHENVSSEAQTKENDGNGSQSESITAKITANTQNLLAGNLGFQAKQAATHQKRKIKVPFVFQAPESGVNERGVHEVLWYERGIEDLRTAEEKKRGDRLVVRFGAVDYEAKVWVDGGFVGGHRGGHTPFELDISDALEDGEQKMGSGNRGHRLTVRVYDSAYDLTQPRGKQYWGAKPESIFYTPSGGIWQNVWLEVVPSARLADSSYGTVLRSNDIDSGYLHAQVAVLGRLAGHRYSVEIQATYNGVDVRTTKREALPKETDTVNLDLDLQLSPEQLSSLSQESSLKDDHRWRNGLALWSPSYPQLYDVTIRLFDSTSNLIDSIQTTTGMRSLTWTPNPSKTVKLNGHPLFQALCLDQGYWPSTLMTPPTPQSLKTDIELAKKMGFNGCRKHQKVEDPLFLYWADHLGYLVWGEMGNAYAFSAEYTSRFNDEWIESVRRDINHPSIITWTPVNESWGYTDLKNNIDQRNHIRTLYYITKTLDPTRPVNDNCGWEHVKTDLTTFHDYADAEELTKTCEKLEGGILGPKANRPMFVEPIPDIGEEGTAHVPGAPVLCTEFAGVNIAPAADGKTHDEWGYTTATDSADLLARIERLVAAVVDGGHCSGFVYTQLADIEQETNGLYNFDRREKIEAGRVRGVMEGAVKRFYDRVGREVE